MRTLQWFWNFFKCLFWPPKVRKKNLKSCSEFLKSTFFPLLPWLPKRPKLKNSCSKMWPIDQLYIELGLSIIAHRQWNQCIFTLCISNRDTDYYGYIYFASLELYRRRQRLCTTNNGLKQFLKECPYFQIPYFRE